MTEDIRDKLAGSESDVNLALLEGTEKKIQVIKISRELGFYALKA